MICHERKFIFIHVNKTGGTSITKLLGGVGADKKHRYACSYERYLPKEFNTYFKFSIVRNPWEKLLSQYFFRIKDDTQHGYSRKDKDLSFLDFLQKPFPAGHALQFDKLSDSKGNLCMDFVGRFENLQEDFNTICDKIGVPQQELPHVNKTKHKHYTEYYDDETRELIAELYAKDIEHFGYEFGR